MLGIYTQYKIFICPFCGLVQYAKEGQGSRKCPSSKCRKSINLEQILVYARTYDIHNAVKIVQQMKEKTHVLQKMEEIRPILGEDEYN